MKRVVSLDEIQASEISPDSIYQEYTKNLQADIKKYFGAAQDLVEIACPGCGKKENAPAFQKIGLQYRKCSRCMSWYVSPRPGEDKLRDFYQNSSACKYWRKEILHFSESHWLHIHAPRIHWILDLVDEFLPTGSLVCDFQSKYPIFLNKLSEEKSIKLVVSVESLLFEQRTDSPKIEMGSVKSTEYREKIGVILAFETLERVADVDQLFRFASESSQKGGLFLITTATCSGFEYQVLGEGAPNLNPINRMNLLSIEALTKKVEEAGFEILELSTPGRLDAQIVQKALRENPDLMVGGFWEYILKNRDEKTWLNLQDFLQLNRLSSHVRIAARKK